MAIPATHTVSVVEAFQSSGTPTFVESLDAITVGQDAGMPLPPVMIYGDDVSHVVTEEGACQTGRHVKCSSSAGCVGDGLGRGRDLVARGRLSWAET